MVLKFPLKLLLIEFFQAKLQDLSTNNTGKGVLRMSFFPYELGETVCSFLLSILENTLGTR